MKTRRSVSSFVWRAESAATMFPRLRLQVLLLQLVPKSQTDWESTASSHLQVQTEWQKVKEQIERHNTVELFSPVIHFMMIPPANSAITWSARECQQTFPEWKVWLLAMTETDFIFSPAGAKSIFQLILPNDEPSVRAKYTWSGEGHFDYHILYISIIKTSN